MNFSPRHHPQVLTALEIVRDRPASYRSTIRSIAMFTVTKCNEYGARFAIEHYTFDRETKRSDIISGIAKSIPDSATLISKAQPAGLREWRMAVHAGMPFSPSDLQLIRRLQSDLAIMPLQCREAALDETAAFYAIQRAGPGSSIRAKARRAADEAQVLWLTFLATCCRENDRTSLGSAYQAWRAIENARPLPF
ncbi:hypothetical protein K5P26_09165 [Sphingopyxis sp. XHP0097]|uniref:Uncharacterized protein n=1 Tax=Sphingopyxis jiangsuensis TaxID=2871171 RepID=A0ABS7MGW0_9SPHN|nr:hypothetical protein [Sphingopyxis jiangsuensis]MBY4637306.1 hypothetical protein [Sphingopyxis jiangsuensis]